MTLMDCPECGGAPASPEEAVIHAFSCPRREENDPARCDYAECREVIDHRLVVKSGKKTCDERCRAAAWKDETGYGRRYKQPDPPAPVRTAPRKPSGLQVAYRKSVEGCIEALAEVGVTGEEAELIAEKRMRSKLSVKQLATLEASERPDPPAEPTPLPLPAPSPLPTPVPDLEPAAEEDPTVRIFQRQRGDRDELVWVEIDQVRTRASAGVALTTWLIEQDPEPMTGRYRAEGNGSHAEDDWAAEAA